MDLGHQWLINQMQESADEEAKHMDKAIDDVTHERLRQIEVCKHGGDTDEFDKGNSQNDWVAYITAYAGRAGQKIARNEKEGCDFRENMVKVAALALAAIEAHDKGYC